MNVQAGDLAIVISGASRGTIVRVERLAALNEVPFCRPTDHPLWKVDKELIWTSVKTSATAAIQRQLSKPYAPDRVLRKIDGEHDTLGDAEPNKVLKDWSECPWKPTVEVPS